MVNHHALAALGLRRHVALILCGAYFLWQAPCTATEAQRIVKGTPMGISTEEVNTLLQKFDEKDDVDALSKALIVVESLDVDPHAPKTEMLTFRSVKLRLLLAMFNHIDAKLIVGFDFADLPSINSVPPPESGLPAGVDPNSIKDPSMRAAYEKKIMVNQAKVKLFNFQSRLHKVDQACVDALENHVSTYYPKSSVDVLSELIDETVRSNDRKVSLKERISAVLVNQR
jgi:hypothetical protein